MADSSYSAINRFRLAEPANHALYILYSYLKRMLLLYKNLTLHRRVYETTDKEGIPLSRIVYIGNLENLDWLEDSMLAGERLRDNRKLILMECRAEVRNWSGSTIVVVDHNRFLTPFLPSGGHTTYPWVRQVISLDSNEYKSRRSNIMSEFRRVMRQQGYSTELTSNSKDVEFFYEKLYSPFVHYRFGNAAHLRSLSELLKAARRGFLIQVFFEDSWIAGDIFRVCGNEIQVLAFGLLPDYQQASRRKTRTVIYPILFEWASVKGYRRINLLRSRPNLKDGVFASKAHRGATAELDSWPHSALQIYVPENLELPGMWKSQLVRRNGKLIPLEDVLA